MLVSIVSISIVPILFNSTTNDLKTSFRKISKLYLKFVLYLIFREAHIREASIRREICVRDKGGLF